MGKKSVFPRAKSMKLWSIWAAIKGLMVKPDSIAIILIKFLKICDINIAQRKNIFLQDLD